MTIYMRGKKRKGLAITETQIGNRRYGKMKRTRRTESGEPFDVDEYLYEYEQNHKRGMQP